MPKQNILTGIRVLDLSQAYSGPYGSQILGDLGAEVIKIETPRIGDSSRVMTPQLSEGQSYTMLALNRNKKGVTLNLRTKTGKEAFNTLVKKSDVVWGNLRHGVMERIGADYDSVSKINPRIIFCNITGYGTSGPYVRYPSYDDNIQALSGILSLCGLSGGKPVRSPVAIADLAGGLFAVIGVTTALYQREQTGKGCKIDLNLVGCCLSLLGTHFQSYFLSGNLPKPAGSHHPIGGISGVFRTRKGFIVLGPCWPRITRVINREYLMDDPRFSTYEKRFENKDELNEAIEEGLLQADAEHWLELMRAEDIPASPLNSLDKVIEDAQIMHNEAVVDINHPAYGKMKAIDLPIKITGATIEEHSPPPTLGQDTDHVLTEHLGYSTEKITELRQEEKEAADELEKHVRHLF
ncbi:CaiB/BaiF CoA transferase family protein [Thermodesulfobacteriota bacterium]